MQPVYDPVRAMRDRIKADVLRAMHYRFEGGGPAFTQQDVDDEVERRWRRVRVVSGSRC